MKGNLPRAVKTLLLESNSHEASTACASPATNIMLGTSEWLGPKGTLSAATASLRFSSPKEESATPSAHSDQLRAIGSAKFFPIGAFSPSIQNRRFFCARRVHTPHPPHCAVSLIGTIGVREARPRSNPGPAPPRFPRGIGVVGSPGAVGPRRSTRASVDALRRKLRPHVRHVLLIDAPKLGAADDDTRWTRPGT